ncbi:MAG: hypothetical protein QGI29_05155 [Pirellulales bacterium]|jgi:hypothetical protein|nr:hypothetical protein [Pirellulales bacterium]
MTKDDLVAGLKALFAIFKLPAETDRTEPSDDFGLAPPKRE